MDSELQQLEEELRGFAPSPVSGEVLSRMVEAMERWEEADLPEEEVVIANDENGKVVAFPSEQKDRSGWGSWGPMWAAAAAVAVLGAALGILMPKDEAQTLARVEGLGPVPVLRQASLVPVNVERKVSSMDAGKVSNKDGMEYQVIRVVRQEEADFRGEKNVGLKITRPKVDYYVVPVSY
jgi:hypothetical protein